MNWKLLSVLAAGLLANSRADISLTIQLSGDQALIKWPSSPGGYYIETTVNIADPQWSPVLQKIGESGGFYSLSVPHSDSARYFRLNTGPNVIFVDIANGSDRESGAMTQPVATIEHGLMLAAQSKPAKEVHVANGVYDLNGGTLQLVSGIILQGGFDSANGWVRTPQTATILRTGPIGVFADRLTAAATLDGFSIQTADATLPGDSAYGVISVNSSLNLRNNIINVGRGAAGSLGDSATAQPQAPRGTGGQFGNCDISTPGAGGPGAISPCGRNGGAGGRGGNPEASGASGTQGVGGTSGGTGGLPGYPAGDGLNGQNGVAGAPGANGAGGSGAVTFVNSRFKPNEGRNGIAGGDGNGGGGGGGGGGQDCPFCQEGGGNGGGGGGAGGCGGAFGMGGGGGGGSFGIFNIIGGTFFVENTIITTQAGSSGGNGGDGGAGGIGGDPGQGGMACLDEIGQGGNGGRGGNGGPGGAGGGGSGGPSIGLYISGTLTQSNNQITVAPGGAPGTGGLHPNGTRASSGATGLSQAVWTLN